MSAQYASRITSDARRSREAHVAQLVEHVLGKDEVTRSIRVVGSRPSFAWAAPFHQKGTDKLGVFSN